MTKIPFGSPCVSFQPLFSSLIFSTGTKAEATRETIMKRKEVSGKGKKMGGNSKRERNPNIDWRMKRMSQKERKKKGKKVRYRATDRERERERGRERDRER